MNARERVMGCLPDPGIEKFARDLRVDQVRGTLSLCASCKTCLECSSFSRPLRARLLSKSGPLVPSLSKMVEGTSTLAVHRCRFVDYTPSPVTALCFPPLPLPSIKGKKTASKQSFPGFGLLVVGRANGNIELCEWTGSSPRSPASQAWVVRKVQLHIPEPS